MNLNVILIFHVFILILICFNVTICLNTSERNIKENEIIKDNIEELDLRIFSNNLSDLEKSNLSSILNYSEYHNVIPKGSSLDYVVQLAIYTLSESKYINKSYFELYTKLDDGYAKNNMFKVVNCFYSCIKGMKQIKLVRQRCFFHKESAELNILPKRVANRVNRYCRRFVKVEQRFSRLLDFVYLLRAILYRSKLHNNRLSKLCKLIWKLTKSPLFKKLYFVKDISDISNKSNYNSEMSKVDISLIDKISNLLKEIDNTLLDKIKMFPFWISKTIEEYNLIMIDAKKLSEKIWFPLVSEIDSNMRKFKKCIVIKNKTKEPPKVSVNSLEENFVSKVSKLAKEIRGDIEKFTELFEE